MKRYIAAVLAVVMMCCTAHATAGALQKSSALILGDFNLDLKVSIKDATSIQKYLAMLISADEESLICGDCDGNLKLNVKDATWIQKYLASVYCPFEIGKPINLPEDTQPSTGKTEATDTAPPSETPAVTSTSASTVIATTLEPTEGLVFPSSSAVIEPNSSTASSPQEITDPFEDSGIALPDDTFTTEPTESETKDMEYMPLKPDTHIDIYFSDNLSWSKVNAYFYNDKTGSEYAPWPGTEMSFESFNDLGEPVYKINVDVSKYNRVVFNNGKSQTLNAAVTVASSGFYVTRSTPKNAMQLGVYPYGATDFGKKDVVKLSYPSGYEKPVEIFTPHGYNPQDTKKKYSVIYLLDGQNQFDDSDVFDGGWGSDEIIASLMKNGGEGIILVGIDNTRNRDNELTPDLGQLIPQYNNGGFKNGTGAQFAEFVAKTVVPYVQANYNVYTDASHSAIVGSSSGGLEAFYIGMEYMNEFGRVGAISPAFMLFGEDVWLNYFKKFDFKNTAVLPRIYIYNGGGDSLEQELLPAAENMPKLLEDLGYASGKLTFVYDEKNAHNEAAWRNIMPETVTWLFELQ